MSPQAARCLRLLPCGATIGFLVLMSIAEYQVRTSPKWPPPAHHELGGWQIEDPALWTFAGALNLPATLPILWTWQLNDRFSYLLDDHSLVVYVPWTLLVFSLWYCVAWRVRDPPSSGRSILMIVIMQTLITAELASLAIAAMTIHQKGITGEKIPVAVIAFFCAWSAAAIVGWIDLLRRMKTRSAA